MSAISETYNYALNVLELVDILSNVSFTTNIKRNVIIKNVKYVLTEDL